MGLPELLVTRAESVAWLPSARPSTSSATGPEGVARVVANDDVEELWDLSGENTKVERLKERSVTGPAGAAGARRPVVREEAVRGAVRAEGAAAHAPSAAGVCRAATAS